MVESVKSWSEADKRYGWKFGGPDGMAVVGVREAARMIDRSHTYIYELLKDPHRTKPGTRAYPLRCGKRPMGGEICICVRSIEEFNKLRAPVEV